MVKQGMKTKDLIKELQEADPSGELHVITDDGIPSFVLTKLGYYDGVGFYIEDDKFIFDSDQDKVVIQAYDLEDFIWKYGGDYSKVEFKGRYVNDNRKEGILKQCEKISRECKEFEQRSTEEMLYRVFVKLNENNIIIQSKEYAITQMNHMFYFDKNEKDININAELAIRKNLCQGECIAVARSGFFEAKDAGDYWEWKLKF